MTANLAIFAARRIVHVRMLDTGWPMGFPGGTGGPEWHTERWLLADIKRARLEGDPRITWWWSPDGGLEAWA